MSDAVALLVSASLRTTAVLAGASMISLLLRRSSASARHSVWTGALATILLTPLLVQMPAWQVTLPHSVARWSPSMARAVTHDRPLVEPAAVVVDTSRPVTAPNAAATTADTPSTAIFIAGIWVAGFSAVLLYAILGIVASARIRRSAARAESSWIEEGRVLARTVGAPRVGFAASTDARAPFVCGVINALVVMPSTVASWDPERRRVVLLHELAHVKRRDCLTHLLGQLACAIYWFHPLSWFAFHRLRVERERACDDFVLAAGVRGSVYAHHLVHVARRAFPHRSLLAATRVALAQHAQLEGRLIAILDPATRPTAPRLTHIGTVVFAVCALGVASLRLQAQPAPPPLPVSQMKVNAPAPISGNQAGRPGFEAIATRRAPVPRAAEQAGLPPSQNPPAASGRLIVLFFDVVTPSPDDRRRATANGVRFVNESMTDADSLAVVTLGSKLNVVRDFTSSREELRTALESPSLLNETAPDVGALARNPISQTTNAATSSDVRLGALTTLCQTLQPIERRKTVLYFTTGMNLGEGAVAELRPVTNACVRAHVAIYPVDVRGFRFAVGNLF